MDPKRRPVYNPPGQRASGQTAARMHARTEVLSSTDASLGQRGGISAHFIPAHFIARICMAGLACALAGCSSIDTTRTQANDAQEFPMIATEAPITAEDIGHRVLKLIDSLQSAQDLAPEHIERITGIPVEINEDDPSIYGGGGKLTADWSYTLVSSPDRLGEKPTSLRFSFDDTSRGRADPADPAPICGMGFDEYTQALVSAGFTAKPMPTFPGSDSWYFSRGDIGVTAYALGTTGAGTAPACLSKLIISAYA